MIKVSVVVPVYNPGPYIEPGIESMLRQTLPPEEFEILYVDDGSTDETPARLDALAAAHPNVRVFHEPNSGWAGRPRNVGIREARGEYIQFLDQDDSMTPDALRLLYEMAVRNGSDIVIGKVASNFRPVPEHLFKTNIEACTLRDAPLISSLTPHKMIRTAFLREHDIRFPEGRVRLEDQLFMVRSYLVARTVSVLADTVCYVYARRDDGGNAGERHAEPSQYFGNLREILDVIVANTSPGYFRTELLSRFYRTGMIDRLSEPYILIRPKEIQDAIYREIRGLATDFVDDDVRETLGAVRRLRGALLLADRQQALLDLAGRLRPLRVRAVLRDLRWAGPRLRVHLRAELAFGREAAPFEVVQREGRAILDPELLAGIHDEPFPVAEREPFGRLIVTLRERTTGAEWRLPISMNVEVVSTSRGEDVGLHPVFDALLALDPTKIASGRPPSPGSWELRVRVFGPGIDRRGKVVPADAEHRVPAAMALRDGSMAIVARADKGGVVLVVTGRADEGGPGSPSGAAAAGPSTAAPLALPVPPNGLEPGTTVDVLARHHGGSIRLTGRIVADGGARTLLVPTDELLDEPGPWHLAAHLGKPGLRDVELATLEIGDQEEILRRRPAGGATLRTGRLVRILWRRAPRLMAWARRRVPDSVARRL